jgi:hypothetical protein
LERPVDRVTKREYGTDGEITRIFYLNITTPQMFGHCGERTLAPEINRVFVYNCEL